MIPLILRKKSRVWLVPRGGSGRNLFHPFQKGTRAQSLALEGGPLEKNRRRLATAYYGSLRGGVIHPRAFLCKFTKNSTYEERGGGEYSGMGGERGKRNFFLQRNGAGRGTKGDVERKKGEFSYGNKRGGGGRPFYYWESRSLSAEEERKL